MPRVQNYQCDGCDQLLHGKDRGAYVDKNSYFTLKGKLSMQMRDEETAKRYYFYIGYDDSEFAFHLPSEADCFQQFLERETMLHHNRRRAQLMAEVGQHGGSDYVPRPQKAQPVYSTNIAPAPAPAPAPQHFGIGGIVKQK
jgi:hypothetical protein